MTRFSLDTNYMDLVVSFFKMPPDKNIQESIDENREIVNCCGSYVRRGCC